jgi:hypothetical protein
LDFVALRYVLLSNGSHFTDLAQVPDVGEEVGLVRSLLRGDAIAENHHFHVHFFPFGFKEFREIFRILCTWKQPVGVN